MPNGVRGYALRQIHALYSVGTFAGLGDGPLLERFATLQGEEAELAFAALVARHGPMVWRVCRRVLRNEHDAQDAFQATWLVLGARPARSATAGTVGNWLFGVASRVSLDARAASSRRRLHERRYAECQNRRGCRQRIGTGTTSARCSTKNSGACPSDTGRRLFCVTSKG